MASISPTDPEVITCQHCHFFWHARDLAGRTECPWCRQNLADDAWVQAEEKIDLMAREGKRVLASS